MTKLLDDLKTFFKDDGWGFTEIEDFPALRLPFRARNGEWACYAQARSDQDLFVFYSIFPIKTPETHRLKMSEFINRANYGLLIGNFEMDFSDGEIRYKTSVAMDEIQLTPALINPVVYANVLTTEHYLPGILSVLNDDKSPEEAVLMIEKQELLQESKPNIEGNEEDT